MATGLESHTTDSVANATEESPLLSSEERGLPPSESAEEDQHWVSAEIRYRVVFLTLATMFTFVLGANLIEAPLTATLEGRICDDLYPGAVESERDCKSPAVQGELASLLGWITTLECVPSLIATVPYGMLSDSWGRHRVLSLALFGMVLALSYVLAVVYFQNIFSFRLVLIYPLFCFVGGGAGVISAMWYTVIADIMPINARTIIFLQMGSITLVASIVAGPLAGAVMLVFGPWTGYLLGLSFIILCWLLSLLLPDTLRLAAARKPAQSGVNSEAEASSANVRQPKDISSPINFLFTKTRKGLVEAGSFLSHHRYVVILSMCFLFEVLAGLAGLLLLQYVTKKFEWSWGKATILLTVRTVSGLIFLSFIVPVVGQLMVTKLKLSPLRKDVWVARVSGIFGVSGALIIAFANTPAVLIIGLIVVSINNACPVILRSIITNLIEPEHMGLVNSLIGVLELLGVMVTSPLLYGSLRLGVEWGGPWLGLPFIGAAGLLSVSTTIIWLLPIREVPRNKDGTVDLSDE